MPLILHPATPWLVAITVLLLGVILWRSSREHVRGARRLLGVPGVVLTIVGTLLTAGAAVAAIEQAAARHRYPAPGRLVDVGGYRLHVLCEGPRGARTVVWLGGSYGQGLWTYAAHRDLARDTRSCIVDRGGLGWSDAGPFPRTVDRVAAETRAALAGAGERGPIVIVGHSFGGLYAASYAQRYPREVAGLVLLDPTAPGWLSLSASQGCPPSDGSPLTMLGTMFGLAYIDALNPLRAAGANPARDRLGAMWEPLVAWELRPAARWSARSAMGEACTDYLAIARTPGALGATPLLLIPQTPEPARDERYMPPGLSPAAQSNYRAFHRMVYDEMAALSARSRVINAPPGAGHMFLDTQPAWTTAQIRGFLKSLDAPVGRGKAA